LIQVAIHTHKTIFPLRKTEIQKESTGLYSGVNIPTDFLTLIKQHIMCDLGLLFFACVLFVLFSRSSLLLLEVIWVWEYRVPYIGIR